MNQAFGSGSVSGLPPAIDGELRLDDAAIDRAFRWLLREGRTQRSGRELMRGLGAELTAGGFPLMRALLAMPTLHPQIASIAYRWSRAAPEVEAFTREHDIWQSDQYLRSPMALIYAGEPMMDDEEDLLGVTDRDVEDDDLGVSPATQEWFDGRDR